HRAERNVRDRGDLLVRELLVLAKDQRLAVFGSESPDRALESLHVGLAQEPRLRTRSAVLHLFDDLFAFSDELVRAIAAEPGVAGVPDDGEEPRTAIARAEMVEIAERPQKGLLNHVVGIGGVAREPARERVGRVEVRKNRRFESVDLLTLAHARLLSSTE